MAESLVIVFFSDGRYHPTAINEAERGKEIKKRQRETRKLTSYGMGKKKKNFYAGGVHLTSRKRQHSFVFVKGKKKEPPPPPCSFNDDRRSATMFFFVCIFLFDF